MKKGKKLLAACMSALMLTGVLRLLPMSEFFKESTLTASAEYAEQSLLKTDVFKELIKEINPKHVISTSD